MAESRRTGIIALAAAAGMMILSLGALVVASTVDADLGGQGIGTRADNFSLRNAALQRVTLSELTRDRPVLLVFGGQAVQGVDVRAVANTLRSAPPVRLVAINPMATPGYELAQIADEAGRPVTVLADPDGTVAARYGVNVPTENAQAVLVSADGIILDRGDLAACIAHLPEALAPRSRDR